jgi:hypothetical protein
VIAVVSPDKSSAHVLGAGNNCAVTILKV